MSEYNLDRFVQAQENTYLTALDEVKNGRKRSHWMWFIFPQIQGLGFSAMSQHYAISDIDEATCYLKHDVLGRRLTEISEALLALDIYDAKVVFDKPDDMKLRSSMTLFAQVDHAPAVFQKVLDKYFSGIPDKKTLQILGSRS